MYYNYNFLKEILIKHDEANILGKDQEFQKKLFVDDTGFCFSREMLDILCKFIINTKEKQKKKNKLQKESFNVKFKNWKNKVVAKRKRK